MQNPREQFVQNCRYLALAWGEINHDITYRELVGCHYTGQVDTARVWEDDTVRIVADLASPALAVIKKENRNPVVEIDPDLTQVRNHGEQAHLFEHVHDQIQAQLARGPVLH